jgi:DNA-binding winged helix-turn-helix (wHTH) protein/TolB-like protein
MADVRGSLPVDLQQSRWSFGSFTLDLGRTELLRDGQVLRLRPKTYDLLVALAGRPGTVFTKDELLERLWPGVVVTEESLTQCVYELRAALGSAGAGLVHTVPRRGYRFDADVRREPAGGPTQGGDVAAAPPPPPPRRGRAAWLIGGALLAAAGSWLIAGVMASPWQTPDQFATAPLPPELRPLSIIVLPLAVEGDVQGAGWLADAIHGDLLVELARMHNSLVIARNTAARYKDRVVDPRQVAREMGVRHVVQGSLRQEGTVIHLNVALIDGETGVQRWAESFRSERARLAQTLEEFPVAIGRTLAGPLVRATAERRIALSPSEVTADDLAMQGFATWYLGVTQANVQAARALFERAVAMDPDSSRGWAGVHFTTTAMLLNGWADPAEATRRHTEVTANLDRVDREGHYTQQAKAHEFFARREFPAMVRHTAAWTERYRLPTAFGAHGAALNFVGRFDEAVPALERALRLSPADPFRAEWQYRLALAHFGAGRHELARDWSQTAAAKNPALPWPPIHAAALHRLGAADEARRAVEEHMRRHPGFRVAHVARRLPSQERGHVEMRQRLVDSLTALGIP